MKIDEPKTPYHAPDSASGDESDPHEIPDFALESEGMRVLGSLLRF